MDKLITTNLGGMPLYQDDFAFIDQIYKNGFEAFCNAFQIYADYFIISFKPSITGSSPNYMLTWDKSYVSYMNEVFVVEAGTLNVGTTSSVSTALSSLYFDIQETYDPAGNKIFYDASTQDTYLKRRMIISTDPGSTITDDINSIDDISDKIDEMLGLAYKLSLKADESTNWDYTSVLNYWVRLTGYAAYEKLRCRKDGIGNIQISGKFQWVAGTQTADGELLFTLPAGIRPAYLHYADFFQDAKKSLLAINSNGECRIYDFTESGIWSKMDQNAVAWVDIYIPAI